MWLVCLGFRVLGLFKVIRDSWALQFRVCKVLGFGEGEGGL